MIGFFGRSKRALTSSNNNNNEKKTGGNQGSGTNKGKGRRVGLNMSFLLGVIGYRNVSLPFSFDFFLFFVLSSTFAG